MSMLTKTTPEIVAADEHVSAAAELYFEVSSPDSVALRRVLRAVKTLSRDDVSVWKAGQLWQPVHAGGPKLFDWYQSILLAAFKDQVPKSIRRGQASRPVSYRTRNILEALLALGRLRDRVP